MTAQTDAVQTSTGTGELFGHPKGLYVCFATELWERFSFYGMKYLLLLYLTKYHLFSDGAGLDVLGAYAGLVYALPVIGGLIADRYLGMRKAVIFGGILLSLGHLGLAYEGFQALHYAAGTTLTHDLTLVDGTVLAAGTTLAEEVTIQDTQALKVFYFSLALIVAGVGYLKPNISTIVGKLYPENDARRDPGFTIFYMGINIGSFAATILCAWLGETYGWSYGFGAAGIGMLVGLVTFIWGQKYLDGHAEPDNPSILKEKFAGLITKENLIYLVTVLSLGLLWLLIQHEPVIHLTQNVALSIAIVGIIFFSMFYHTANANKLVATFLALITLGLGITWAVLESGLVEKLAINETILLATFISLVVFIVYGFIKHNSVEFSRTVVLMVLILSTIVFWALFEQSAGSMTFYADRVMNRELINTTLASSDAWKFYLPGAILAAIGIYLWFSSIKLSSRDGSLKFVFMTVLATTIIPIIAVYLLSLTGQYVGYVLLMFPLVALIVSIAFILIGFFYKRLEHSVFASDEVNISSAAKAIIGSTILAGGAYLIYYGLQLGSLAQGQTSPFSIVPTAGQFGSLNAMYIILLAAPFAALWTWLDKRKMDPSTPVKFALGIIQVGLGFGALIIGANNPDEAGKVGMIWLVLTYLLHTTGELCLSPVGLSAVTKLSISRVVGVSMGTWFLATALSETIATRLGKIAAIDTDAGEVTDVTAALAKYTELYEFLFYFGLGFGIFMLIISPLLKKGMHGIK